MAWVTQGSALQIACDAFSIDRSLADVTSHRQLRRWRWYEGCWSLCLFLRSQTCTSLFLGFECRVDCVRVRSCLVARSVTSETEDPLSQEQQAVEWAWPASIIIALPIAARQGHLTCCDVTTSLTKGLRDVSSLWMLSR